ncbi:hypothetical protein C3941_08325 [Kaistia algarum]|nr:hypothetical protein C3941_08325 [Kaistia algarum]
MGSASGSVMMGGETDLGRWKAAENGRKRLDANLLPKPYRQSDDDPVLCCISVIAPGRAFAMIAITESNSAVPVALPAPRGGGQIGSAAERGFDGLQTGHIQELLFKAFLRRREERNSLLV